MKVRVTTKAGSFFITQQLTTYTWSGSKSSCARAFTFTSLRQGDGLPELVDPPVGALVELLEDDGTPRFLGVVVRRGAISTEQVVAPYRCLDRGLYLNQNAGWYSVKDTPEALTKRICGDFGVPAGSLAATGITITRKFPGVALNKIIGTMYSLASEQNGKRYLVSFDGAGALCVTEKTETASGLVLAPKVNLMNAALTESIEKMCNSVAIYDEYGNKVRVLEDKDAVSAYGLMQQAVTQTKKDDGAAKGKLLLEDGGLEQSVEVECLGDTRLVTGATVLLKENGSGLTGVFCIDEDTHTWKNGLHVTRLTLNLRNVMDKQSAGSEVK